jgi:hypothetical protein
MAKTTKKYKLDTISNTEEKKKKKVKTFPYLLVSGTTGEEEKKKKKVKTFPYLLASGTTGEEEKKKKSKTKLKYIVMTEDGDKKKKKQKIIKMISSPLVKYNNDSKLINWGLGVEHEMQLFHQDKSGMKNTNILFDSQESTCFLTGDIDEKGVSSCNKLVKREDKKKLYEYPTGLSKQLIFRKESDKLTPEEMYFLKNMDWELTGRQFLGCKDVLGSAHIMSRTPILMPELITGNHVNRTIESINNEIIDLENLYIRLQMKNPITREKVKKYGPLVTHMCGSSSNIKIPVRPTVFSDSYQIYDDTFADYLGSYHVTITLPHANNILTENFVKIHQDFGNQFQWLEPLLISSFFSPETFTRMVEDRKIEGSFRIMTVGWGNMGSSDVRKLGITGITRGSNIKTKWRKGLKYKSSKKLTKCNSTGKTLKYKGSVDLLLGDLRTFGFTKTMEECKKLMSGYDDHDCPKVDGGVLKPPNGLEIRIFDHFQAKHLEDLLRIIVLIAANSQRHPPTTYVYTNRVWNKTLRDIMRHGWNTRVSNQYINILRSELGLDIHTDSFLAYDVFKTVVNELFDKNHQHSVCSLMMNEPMKRPNVPQINRQCWEISFNKTWLSDSLKACNNMAKKRKIYTRKEFCKTINYYLTPKNKYLHFDDIIYALESNGRVKLITKNSIITHVHIK